MSTLSVTRIENVQDFDFANTQFVSAYATANAAYSTANTKLPLSGGTITGDLVVTGNATFSGMTTYANTQTLLIGDSLFTLNADLPASVAATENAGMEVNRGLYGNSSIIWDETNKRWDVKVNNNTAMTVTEAGDVGVGISTGLTRKFMVYGDLDNAVKMAVRNNANSNNAFTQFTVESNNTNLYAYSFPTNYLTSGRYIAGSGVIETTGPAGLTFVASSTATGNITFWTGATATEKMRISSAGDVGVGTTSPIYKLDVNGSANISNATLIVAGSNVVSTLASSFNTTNIAFNTANAAFASANNVAPQVTPAYNTANLAYALANTIFASSNADYVVSNSAFAKANSALANTADVTFAGRFNIPERLLVTQSTSGTNGILVNMPTGAETTASGLRVKGYSPAIELMDKDSIQNWYMGIDDNDSNKLIFGRGYGPGQGVTQAITVDTSDNVGIGTASPGYKLTVAGNNPSLTNWIGSVNETATGGFGAGFISYIAPTNFGYLYQSGAGNLYLTNANTGGSVYFTANGSTRMLIDTSGNIGIGTTAPGYKLDVAGAANISNPTLLVGGQNVVSVLSTSYNTANAAFASANNVGPQLAPAFNTANAAYAAANSALSFTWDMTVKTSAFTASSNTGYFVNTTSGAVVVNLPSSPVAGARVTIVDYAGTSATNNIVLNLNGRKLNGITANGTINTTRASFEMIYADSTQGWVNYSSYIQSTPGQSYTAEYLIVAGGGGSGTYYPGGGGAGGLLGGSYTVAATTAYSITVGAGGASAGGSIGGSSLGGSGGNSSAFGYTAIGGGGGGNLTTGGSGGSGGGGGNGSTGGGSGTAGQGNAGGNGSGQGGHSNISAGGGGGASAAGTSGSQPGTRGPGGNGSSAYSAWGLATGTGENVGGTYYYAGGGGGGNSASGAAAPGGYGGGGAGGYASSTPNGTAGTTNTGGGAGGGAENGSSGNGRAGGSGIVIIRYAGSQRGTGGTITTSGGYTYHVFTTSGTFTA